MRISRHSSTHVWNILWYFLCLDNNSWIWLFLRWVLVNLSIVACTVRLIVSITIILLLLTITASIHFIFVSNLYLLLPWLLLVLLLLLLLLLHLCFILKWDHFFILSLSFSYLLLWKTFSKCSEESFKDSFCFFFNIKGEA